MSSDLTRRIAEQADDLAEQRVVLNGRIAELEARLGRAAEAAGCAEYALITGAEADRDEALRLLRAVLAEQEKEQP